MCACGDGNFEREMPQKRPSDPVENQLWITARFSDLHILVFDFFALRSTTFALRHRVGNKTVHHGASRSCHKCYGRPWCRSRRSEETL